jgi:hypothetical protein
MKALSSLVAVVRRILLLSKVDYRNRHYLGYIPFNTLIPKSSCTGYLSVACRQVSQCVSSLIYAFFRESFEAYEAVFERRNKIDQASRVNKAYTLLRSVSDVYNSLIDIHTVRPQFSIMSKEFLANKRRETVHAVLLEQSMMPIALIVCVIDPYISALGFAIEEACNEITDSWKEQIDIKNKVGKWDKKEIVKLKSWAS